ncbi:hypothetical protein C8R47DRAFT_1065332 [Mycena vitilis]|nr:hypothetical protein C8R47DRAFT_1065332 [Mycena vitilis]
MPILVTDPSRVMQIEAEILSKVPAYNDYVHGVLLATGIPGPIRISVPKNASGASGPNGLDFQPWLGLSNIPATMHNIYTLLKVGNRDTEANGTTIAVLSADQSNVDGHPSNMAATTLFRGSAHWFGNIVLVRWDADAGVFRDIHTRNHMDSALEAAQYLVNNRRVPHGDEPSNTADIDARGLPGGQKKLIGAIIPQNYRLKAFQKTGSAGRVWRIDPSGSDALRHSVEEEEEEVYFNRCGPNKVWSRDLGSQISTRSTRSETLLPTATRSKPEENFRSENPNTVRMFGAKQPYTDLMSILNHKVITFPDDFDESRAVMWQEIETLAESVQLSSAAHTSAPQSAHNRAVTVTPPITDSRDPVVRVYSHRMDSAAPRSQPASSPYPRNADHAGAQVVSNSYAELGLAAPPQGTEDADAARERHAINEAVIAAQILRVGQDVASLETSTSLRHRDLLRLIDSTRTSDDPSDKSVNSALSDEIRKIHQSLTSTRDKLGRTIDAVNNMRSLRSEIDDLKARLTVLLATSPHFSATGSIDPLHSPLPDILPEAPTLASPASNGRHSEAHTRPRETDHPQPKRRRISPRDHFDVHVHNHHHDAHRVQARAHPASPHRTLASCSFFISGNNYVPKSIYICICICLLLLLSKDLDQRFTRKAARNESQTGLKLYILRFQNYRLSTGTPSWDNRNVSI